MLTDIVEIMEFVGSIAGVSTAGFLIAGAAFPGEGDPTQPASYFARCSTSSVLALLQEVAIAENDQT